MGDLFLFSYYEVFRLSKLWKGYVLNKKRKPAGFLFLLK